MKRKTIFFSALIWAVVIAAAFARPTEAASKVRTVYGDQLSVASALVTTHRVDTNHQRRFHLVSRPVVAPAAAVSRELAQQPVMPHLAELIVVHTRVLFDPEMDYARQGHGLIDENHHLLTAQRLYRALHTPGAYVMRPRMAQTMKSVGRRMIKPHMIITKPKVQPRPRRGDDEGRPIAQAR